MLPALVNRQSLVFKLVAVLVLCVFCAISWHTFAAQHTDHIHFTEQCQICHWMQTAVCIVASVSFFCALYPIQRIVVFSSLIFPTLSFQGRSGRSPPRR